MTLKALTMNARILLYISAAGASCALYRNSSLLEVHSLACDEEGWEDFNTLLLKHPGRPVAIAVDTVDEIYRQDLLPRVRGADRREMTERRLRQLIHHSAYRAALHQKSLPSVTTPDPLRQRNQERYLMMGLTNAEIVRPWLDIMHVRGAHLAGIWLLPALAIPLAKKFKLSDSRMLLVSEQTGGLRLTYLEQGELRFSRLAPVDSNQYDNPLEGYAEEIERTRQALVGQRLLARSEPLRTLLLDPLNTLAELHALLPESAGFQCESIMRGQLLDTLKLPPSLLAESSDALYLKLLSEAPKSANLMTREQHAVTHLHWLRRGFLFVAVAWASLALIASALLWLDTWRLEHNADLAQQTSMQNRNEEAQLLATAGGTQALKHRRYAVEVWHGIAHLEQNPALLFEAIQQITQTVGDVHIRQMAWFGSATNAKAMTAYSTESEPGVVIEGEIEPFDNNFVAARQRVQMLVDQLQSGLTGHRNIKVLRWPLDNDSSNALEGEFGHSRINARFRIQITEHTP